jgi:hypothetical protein
MQKVRRFNTFKRYNRPRCRVIRSIPPISLCRYPLQLVPQRSFVECEPDPLALIFSFRACSFSECAPDDDIRGGTLHKHLWAYREVHFWGTPWVRGRVNFSLEAFFYIDHLEKLAVRQKLKSRWTFSLCPKSFDARTNGPFCVRVYTVVLESCIEAMYRHVRVLGEVQCVYDCLWNSTFHAYELCSCHAEEKVRELYPVFNCRVQKSVARWRWNGTFHINRDMLQCASSSSGVLPG